MKSVFIPGVAVALFLLATQPSAAGGFPKTGQADFDQYATWKVLASQDSGVGRELIVEGNGITRNVKGEAPFDSMVDHCLGQWTVIGKHWDGHGSCIKTDRDGDRILLTWDSKGWSIVGGTGKYKGITGGGTQKLDLLSDAPDGWAAVVHHTVSCNFQ